MSRGAPAARNTCVRSAVSPRRIVLTCRLDEARRVYAITAFLHCTPLHAAHVCGEIITPGVYHSRVSPSYQFNCQALLNRSRTVPAIADLFADRVSWY